MSTYKTNGLIVTNEDGDAIGIFSKVNFLNDKIDEIKKLIYQNKKMVEALSFIESGCLVPPDGGSPCLMDAVEYAKQVLKDIEYE